MRDLNKHLETRARGIETLEISLRGGECMRLARNSFGCHGSYGKENAIEVWYGRWYGFDKLI